LPVPATRVEIHSAGNAIDAQVSVHCVPNPTSIVDGGIKVVDLAVAARIDKDSLKRPGASSTDVGREIHTGLGRSGENRDRCQRSET
jgi:hypothetical protein